MFVKHDEHGLMTIVEELCADVELIGLDEVTVVIRDTDELTDTVVILGTTFVLVIHDEVTTVEEPPLHEAQTRTFVRVVHEVIVAVWRGTVLVIQDEVTNVVELPEHDLQGLMTVRVVQEVTVFVLLVYLVGVGDGLVMP